MGKVYSLGEITDSNILYRRNPPKFMYYIISMVVILIGIFLIWSSTSVKTFIVKGQGLVARENKVSIMAKVSGEIKEVNIQEGKVVKAGDLLLTFNSAETNMQVSQGEGQLNYINRRIELLKRAESEVIKGINTFDSSNEEEKEFYNRIVSYNYKCKEYKIDENSLKEQNYTDKQIEEYKKQSITKTEQLRYETIISFTTEKSQLESQKANLESQIGALNKSKEEYKLYSPCDGIVHLNSEFKCGMVLQGGTLLGNIQNSNEQLIIESLVPSSDRPRIKTGDEVYVIVGGLSQTEYGTLDGIVESIDEDATIDEKNGNAYFKVKIRPSQSYLEDKKGERVNLTPGMISETRVKYEKITYLKYYLEQIGIKFN